MQIIKEFIQTLIILLLVTFPLSSNAQKSIIIVNEQNQAIFISDISTDSVDKIKQLYRKTHFKVLSITSPGGDFDAGVDFAEFVQKNKIFVYVPIACNSSCSLIFFSTDNDMRDMADDATLGLHNISIETNSNISDESYLTVGELKKFMNIVSYKVGFMLSLYASNGIPSEVLLEISGKHGKDSVDVTRKDLVKWGALSE